MYVERIEAVLNPSVCILKPSIETQCMYIEMYVCILKPSIETQPVEIMEITPSFNLYISVYAHVFKNIYLDYVCV